MKLSIITINRNNENGLRKTITSVLNQSWSDFEYIIVDGASTDNSVDVIKNEISSVPEGLNSRIQFISETDSGVFNAMNKGIVMAKGDYLLFLNSGDFFVDNNVLSNVFCVMRETDILSCSCRVSKNGEQVFITTPPTNYTFGFFYNNSLAHQATFIKKDLFNKFGLYREDLKFMGDWEFFVRTIVIAGASTQNIDVILTDYNLEGISSVSNNQYSIIKEKQTVFEEKALKCFVPDYDYFYQFKQNIAIMEWAWSKKLFRMPILLIYRFIANYRTKRNFK